jgi:hypothetical protein
MTKFKVGDLVKIVDISLSQTTGDLLGKITTIKGYNLSGKGICLENNNYGWESWQLQKIVPAPKTNNIRHLQGKFIMPDGTPGVVSVTIFGNVTQVTIVVGIPPYKAINKDKQFWAGVAYCCPTDVFNINVGVRLACRHALINKYFPKNTEAYRRSIYSAIRKEMVSKG